MSRPARVVSCLKEAATFYRGVVFDLGSLAGTDCRIKRAGALRCVSELRRREKQVALTRATASRASVVSKAASQVSCVLQDARSWSSGEHVFNCFQRGAEHASESWTFLRAEQPVRVYELSSIAMPTNLAGWASRSAPPLTELHKAGHIRVVDDLEKADVCYWDLHDGDSLGDLLEASLELCLEHKVPLLHAHGLGGSSALVASSRGSPAHSARSFGRLGGSTMSADKLDGFMKGVGWDTAGLDERDVLLVTEDLGDVAVAAAHGVDVLLVLSPRAESQLTAFQDDEWQVKAKERRTMGMSERLANDSPAMLSAGSNPLMTVFKLPFLLAEASRKNAESRAQKAAMAARSPTQAHVSENAPIREDPMELLQRWCRSAGVQVPIVAPSKLQWDDKAPAADDEHVPASQSTDRAATAAATPTVRAVAAPRGRLVDAIHSTPGLPDSVPVARTARAAAAARRRSGQPQVESVDDIFGKLKG